ncbi:MAG: Ala-tRNA(Pro) deacylase [Planctomycetota bacterium]|jgi:Ala-tRNA(Pro) deacylase
MSSDSPPDPRELSCHGPTPITKRIRGLLDEAGVDYRYVEHGPTKTSEESAVARGESLTVGGKSIVLRVGETFRVCVLSAARRLNSNRIRRRFGERSARFATRDELHELTGLVPGCVPPFGPPILELPNCLDEAFLDYDRIAFNAGSLTCSIVMPRAAYVELAKPEIFLFSKA